MRLSRTAVLACVSIAALTAGTTGAVATNGADGAEGGDRNNSDRTLTAIGLASQGTRLVRFRTDEPENARVVGQIDGLRGDRRLVGIDYRVQNGRLYGVGNEGGIYILTRDADANKVSQLTVPLQGRFFGVDFNPAANALRVISNTGQNLRHSFATTPPGPTTVDGSLNYEDVSANGVTAAAYTNNDLDEDTATTLYDVDTVMDQVSIQAPANQGDLSPTGKLGIDASANAGFDIYSTVRDGSTVNLMGFATLRTDAGFRLYKVTLFTGKAVDRGAFDLKISDISFPLGQL